MDVRTSAIEVPGIPSSVGLYVLAYGRAQTLTQVLGRIAARTAVDYTGEELGQDSSKRLVNWFRTVFSPEQVSNPLLQRLHRAAADLGWSMCCRWGLVSERIAFPPRIDAQLLESDLSEEGDFRVSAILLLYIAANCVLRTLSTSWVPIDMAGTVLASVLFVLTGVFHFPALSRRRLLLHSLFYYTPLLMFLSAGAIVIVPLVAPIVGLCIWKMLTIGTRLPVVGLDTRQTCAWNAAQLRSTWVQRLARQECLRCGYSLLGRTSITCVECGCANHWLAEGSETIVEARSCGFTLWRDLSNNGESPPVRLPFFWGRLDLGLAARSIDQILWMT